MQQQGLNCERDEYPPVSFWQGEDTHDQYIRMVPKVQNGGAGALFALKPCNYRTKDGLRYPPASTGNPRFDRVIHGPGRDTSIYTVEVTTTLSTVSIVFNAYPNQNDFGLTANPCWPSTIVDDPGFALLVSDPWYAAQSNAQRRVTASLYSNPPPLAFTQNNPPRAGYERRGLEAPDTDAIAGEAEEAPWKGLSMPRAREAETTAADVHSVPRAASTAATAGGGGLSASDSIPKPTSGSE